jgi:hypothetical protein
MIDMVSQTVNNVIECSWKCQAEGEHAVVPHTFKLLARNPITHSYFTLDEDHKPLHDGKCPSPYLHSQCPICCGSDTYLTMDGLYVIKLGYTMTKANFISILGLIYSFLAMHVSRNHVSMINMGFMTLLSVTVPHVLYSFHQRSVRL